MNFEIWLKEAKKTTIKELCTEVCSDSGDIASYAQPIAGGNITKMAPEPIEVNTDLKPKKKKKSKK